MTKPVPFGAPKDINEAQRKICSTAASLANMRVREKLLSEDNDLTRALRQQKKQSLEAMRRSWAPLKSDWHYGMALKIRDSDVKWLMKSEYADFLEEAVTESFSEAILIHSADWVGPMLNDAFVSELPYYRMDDMPSRRKRLWDRIRRR